MNINSTPLYTAFTFRNDNFLNQDDIVQINSHHPESNVVFTHTFMASRPTSIPSNNTEHKVSLALIKVLPEFQHISQPELNSNVYLQANVTNSSEFPLLAGYCSVFLDGNFLSKTNLPNVSPQEPFSLSLGADSQVKVSYFSGHKHRRRQQGNVFYSFLINRNFPRLHRPVGIKSFSTALSYF